MVVKGVNWRERERERERGFFCIPSADLDGSSSSSSTQRERERERAVSEIRGAVVEAETSAKQKWWWWWWTDVGRDCPLVVLLVDQGRERVQKKGGRGGGGETILAELNGRI